jgi:hypothetical protein
MSAPAVLGAFPDPPAPALSAIELEVVPIDLLTEWRRCGMVADFMADYMVHAFERRDVARSILSTVANELVENAAKFSSNKRGMARVAIRHHGEVVHAEVRNGSTEKHVQALREVLSDLQREDATAVFRRRMEDRRGLGLALLAKDYGATVGATAVPGGTAGEIVVCLRVALSAAEVEQR